MTAHPPRIRWHVETYDPTAREWSAGLPLRNQHAAVRKLNHLTTTDPTWPDGTARVRRLVLETTTFQDLSTAAPLPRFPRGGFIFTDHADQDLGAVPDQTPDGRPALRVIAGSHEVGHAQVTLPLDRLEEVVAGLRDTARQTGGETAPVRRRLTEAEHDRAWHAIDGLEWQAFPDADTVLNAVLRALAIDPPAGVLRVDLAGQDVTADLADPAAEHQRAAAGDRAYRRAYHMPQRFPGDSPAMRAAAIATCHTFVGVSETCARCSVPIAEHDEVDR